jgi:hypothetical protein
MFSNLSIIFKKYSVPGLFFIMGVVLFITGATGEQNTMFMISSIMMFMAGALSILYSTGTFKSTLLYLFGGLAGVAAIATLYLSFNSVKDTSTYMKNYELCKGKSIRNLEDIRFVQKAYAEKNGVYAKDWETLIDFVKNGTVPYVESEGSVPGRRINEAERDYLIQFGLYKKGQAIDFNMTEKEAYYLSKWANCPEDLKGFRRDTIQRSLYDMKFKSQAYVDSRIKAGYGKFYADSLPLIPFTGGREKWKMETQDSLMIGEDRMPAMMVSGKIPFAKIQGTATEELSFGTLSSPDLIGNWEDK